MYTATPATSSRSALWTSRGADTARSTSRTAASTKGVAQNTVCTALPAGATTKAAVATVPVPAAAADAFASPRHIRRRAVEAAEDPPKATPSAATC